MGNWRGEFARPLLATADLQPGLRLCGHRVVMAELAGGDPGVLAGSGHDQRPDPPQCRSTGQVAGQMASRGTGRWDDGWVDNRDVEPALQVREVQPGMAGFGQVLTLAARVLAQDRNLTSRFPHAQESHVLGAFDGTGCVGFLRYLIQVIGAEVGRPAVIHNGEPLREGYVEAFGVDPQRRRHGVGTALQQHAAQQCRVAGCYQIRSRSPVTSTENYALKIAAGYVIQPSDENDSYYFLLHL